ncbi:MAG TPA: DUF61 family protein [Methanotrichaceae archaeon]|nr:DUF61 family protein [Methanotrichaceae archaeon]
MSAAQFLEPINFTQHPRQGEAEVELVSKILNKSKTFEKQLIIYMPEVRELRRKLPTTTQYAFIVNLRDRSMDE